MKIDFKFDFNDIAYVFKKNKISEGKISDIRMTISEDKRSIEYGIIFDELKNKTYKKENEIFKTKDELLDSLR